MKDKEQLMTNVFIILLFLIGLGFSTIDTRLNFVSNTYNSPSAGKGTLVIDVEARSNDGSSYDINAFQDAFQLDATLQAQNPTFSFSNELFPSPDYTTTEDYDGSSGRVRYIYTFDSGTRGTIGTAWTRVVTITIQYDMTNSTSTVSWYSGIPNYFVMDASDNVITGSEETIPSELTDFSLPVELSSFTVRAGDNRAILSWQTASEVENAGFEIWRSQEETGSYQLVSSFRNNPELRGAGNSNQQHNYRFVDPHLTNGITFWYKLADVDFNGQVHFNGPLSVVPNNSGAAVTRTDNLPERFALHQNYPNPFNPETTLRFDIPAVGRGMVSVKLVIYNALGKQVRALLNGPMQPGSYLVKWDGRDDQSQQVSSGVYFYSLRTDNFVSVKKMMLLR